MSRKRVIQGLLGAIIAFASLAMEPASAAAQATAVEVERVATRFAEARGNAVHLVAPRAFREAVERLEEARRRIDDGDDSGGRERLREAEARLEAAVELANGGRRLFADALASRAAAERAEAEIRAADLWGGAESELEEAGQRFERDAREDAAVRAGRAVLLYERASQAAWRDRWLGAAVQARQRAVALGAESMAPEAFAEGESALRSGESEILAGRVGEGPQAAGATALAAFERAADLATLADSVLRRRVPVERLVLTHEADLAALALAASVESSAGRPDETRARIASEIGRLRSEEERLGRELAASREEAARLSERIEALAAELAESEQRFIDARDDLLALRERDARLREASALFSPEEGEVFVTGDRLTIRLYGLVFGSGADEIAEEHYPLLTKVQRIIEAFEGARIRIEGHTDSRGRAESNQALSQRRAIAVREHLLTQLPIPSSRFEAVGLGESRPIAAEDTEEGRARNRRIEIVLTLEPG